MKRKIYLQMRSRAEARQLDVSAEDVLSGRALEMYDRAMKAAQRAEQKAEETETGTGDGERGDEDRKNCKERER